MQTALLPQESGTLAAHHWPVQSIAFTKSRGLMATGDTQRYLRIWRNSQLLHELHLSSKQDKVRPTERIRGLAFSPTGDSLYVACGDKLRAINTANGEERWSYSPPRSFGFLIISPVSVAVSESGDVAATTDAGRLLHLTSEGAIKARWWDNDSPRQIHFLNGDRLIGTDSFSLCTWRLSVARKLTRRKLAERTYGFAATRDGSRVVLRTIHDVQLWDVTSDVMLAQYDVPFGPPLVAVAENNNVAIAGVHEIHVHRASGGPTQIHLPDASVRSLHLDPSGEIVSAGCSDGTIRSWNLL